METYYVLDDDFEAILKRAGCQQQQLLGMPLPLLNSFEFLRRTKAQTDSPLFKLLGADDFFDVEEKEQYARAMQALADHTVATIKTDASGNGTSTALPAGNYHVYGTAEDFVKTGARGTITGNTVTLSDTGINAVTIWNLRTAIKPGTNIVTLTRDNAAFDPFAR